MQSYAKISQIEWKSIKLAYIFSRDAVYLMQRYPKSSGKVSSLLVYFPEMQIILCKDSIFIFILQVFFVSFSLSQLLVWPLLPQPLLNKSIVQQSKAGNG